MSPSVTVPMVARWPRRTGVAAALLILSCGRRASERSDAAAIPSAAEPPRASADAVTRGAESVRTAAASRVDGFAGAANAIDAGEDPPNREDALRVLRFPWRPPGATGDAYALEDPEDQHRIVLVRGARVPGTHPVLVAFHGQPKRGQAPRSYAFAAKVIETTLRSVERGEARPLVLVLPVFRFFGTNWPDFDVEAFRGELDRKLAAIGIEPTGYYLVGHSGAAGCGGDGMNRAHRMRPAAVGFFDTCLGRGWRDEVQRLRALGVPTLLMHSLETAGFSPRQATEYLPTFDFGRAYGPAGLVPGPCPTELPSAPLRDQPYRCSADEQGHARGLIVDSGEGEEGHNALVPIALEYFLKKYVGAR